MSQSGVIFGAIVIAFFVYITRKGELPVYAGLLLLAPGGSQATSTPGTSSAAAAVNATSTSVLSGALAAFGA